MLMDLARARQIVHGGHEVVPTWRILTPEDDFIIHTRLDPDKHGQRQRMLTLIPRFMRWKMATAFAVTVETWLGPGIRSGEEATLSVGVSQTERLGAMHRIQRLPY